jgi:hypothetical protein
MALVVDIAQLVQVRFVPKRNLGLDTAVIFAIFAGPALDIPLISVMRRELDR